MLKRLFILCIGISLVLGSTAYAEMRIQSSSSTQTPKSQQQEKPRYVTLFKDSSYTYYMDTRTAKWKLCPRTASEQIIDVWIKLESNDGYLNRSKDKQKFYLEHYLIRPDKQQIQFLAELEVTGRPANTIQEREYSVSNWEDLVPGSIEEELYNAVMKNTSGLKHEKVEGNSASHDMIEDVFRISI